MAGKAVGNKPVGEVGCVEDNQTAASYIFMSRGVYILCYDAAGSSGAGYEKCLSVDDCEFEPSAEVDGVSASPACV